MSPHELPAAYVIRLTRRATAEIQVAWEHFAETADESVADRWQAGLENALASLALMPERNAIAENESGLLGFPLRRHLYRRTASSPAYLIFYRLVDASDEPPTIRIIHIRHGSRAPLDEDEAALIGDE